MRIINLRDFYPWYTQDEFIEVTDLVADTIDEMERDDHAYYECRRVYQHYILGMSITDIALSEGAVKSSVCESIWRGLRIVRNYIKFFR